MTLPLPTIAARVITVAGFSFSRTLDKLMKMVDSGQCSSSVVAAIIASDPVLTALTLGRANAGAEGEVVQVSGAVLVLGLSTVRGMIEEVMPLAERGVRLMAGYWSQANATATMCRILVDRCAIFAGNRPDDEVLHVAGLLHTLGDMVAAIHFTAEYDVVIQRLRRGEGPFAALMKEELGADPGELGALVARAWNLPPTPAAVIRHHLRSLRAPEALIPLASLVHVARQLARGCGFVAGQDIYVEPIQPEVLALLGLNAVDLGAILDAFFAEMDELEVYEGLLVKAMRT